MQNIKVPDDNRWENCAYARNLPKLQLDPAKYVMTKRNEFHLCANCVTRLDGVAKVGWLLEKVKQDNDHRHDLVSGIRAEKKVRVSGW